MDEWEISRTPAYKKAFNDYLRRGTPIEWSLQQAAARGELSLKADLPERPTTHYIWRTRGDNKVRASHAANNGKVFAWDNPPPTRHPGEDYGCRCWAEPYVHGESEFAYQTMISGMHDNPDKWGSAAFIQYFYFGEGVSVGLGETGNFAGVVNFYFYTLGKYNDINAQIINEARNRPSGTFEYKFKNSYQFKPYLFVLGRATVSGIFHGIVQHQNERMSISGTIEYQFEDTFTDPRGKRQAQIGTSDPAAATPELLDATEYGGTYYDIIGLWLTSFHAGVKKDEHVSLYRWE